MARVAVEDRLSDVKNALQSRGHDVVSLSENNMQNCECCVISGEDQNVMGIADRATRASVINARGMTADEIANRVEESVQRV